MPRTKLPTPADDDEPTAAEMLRSEREDAGLSQSEAAARAGVSVRSLQQWEQGRREPAAGPYLRLLAAYGIYNPSDPGWPAVVSWWRQATRRQKSELLAWLDGR